MSLDEMRALLARMNNDERHAVLRTMREEFGVVVHPLETAWNTSAESILEAIHASADLTQRGVRGVLAEATFRRVVVPQQLARWRSIPFTGDLPYDLQLDDGKGPLKVQVKNQRREKGEPKIDKPLTRSVGSTVYAVETQRTRNGQAAAADGEKTATRPYRFGEFDILAVCLQPSTGRWEDFIYCPGHLLLPRPDQPKQLKVMQPIYCDGSHGWTRSFDDAAKAARKHLASAAGP